MNRKLVEVKEEQDQGRQTLGHDESFPHRLRSLQLSLCLYNDYSVGGLRIRAFHHHHHHHTLTHTHTRWWVGRMKRNNTTNQYAEETKRWVFSLELKEESEEECLTESFRSQVRSVERISPAGSFCLSLNAEDPSFPRLSEESEENRDEATQRGMEELYQRQCGSSETPLTQK